MRVRSIILPMAIEETACPVISRHNLHEPHIGSTLCGNVRAEPYKPKYTCTRRSRICYNPTAGWPNGCCCLGSPSNPTECYGSTLLSLTDWDYRISTIDRYEKTTFPRIFFQRLYVFARDSRLSRVFLTRNASRVFCIVSLEDMQWALDDSHEIILRH